MKQLILNALRESVEAHPELIPLLTGKAAAHVKLMGLTRDEIERKLARVISRGFRGELEKLLEYLGDPPDFNRVPPEYWQNGWRSIQADVEPILVEAYIQQAEALMVRIGIGVDWAGVNTAAANWARLHSETVMRELFNRTYEGVSTLVPQYFEQHWRMSDLSAALERYYSSVRAEMIAVTETTRALVEGEKEIIAALSRESGAEMVPIWMTAHDERVCPLCGPRNEKPITDGNYPPAHPNCRCGVGYEWPETLNATQAELWRTR